MSNPGNGTPKKRAINNYTGDRIPFSDRANENGKPSRRRFDPSRQTYEEQSQVNKEDIESLKNATHQSIIEQNLRRSREAGEKSDIRKSEIHRQSQRFDPYKREVEEKISNHSLDEVDRQAMLQIQDYRRKARERWEDEIRRQTAPLVNETGNNEIHSKHSSSEGDPHSDKSNFPADYTKSSLDPVRQAAVEQMRELRNNPESVLAYRHQGKIYVTDDVEKAKKEFDKKTIDKLNALGLGHTFNEVRFIHLEDAIIGTERFGLEPRVDITAPQVEKHQDTQADAIETERLSKIEPAKKRVTFAPNLEEVRFFNDAGFIDREQNEGVRISSKDGKDAKREADKIVRTEMELTRQKKIIDMGLQDLALQPGTTVYFKNTDGKPIYTFENQENGSIRLSLRSEAKENERPISSTDAVERIQTGAEVKNEDPIYAARYYEIPVGDNYWPKTLITDDEDAYDHMVLNRGYRPLDDYEKQRYEKISDFVDSSQISKVPEWMRDLKRGDFEEFYQRPLKVEDFTKNSQDILREDEAIHEGEYSARERRAHDKFIDIVHRKLIERLEGRLGSSELRTDSTGMAKIRFYAYESGRGDLLFTNKKYTDQDCASRDLKRVSLDYAVEKLEYLEAQGAVRWKLPPAYAIKSESNTIATYDKNLAEHMMTNDGYKELMSGTRDGIDLSDPDDQEPDEALRLAQLMSMDSMVDHRPVKQEDLDERRRKFDESEDGIKLAKLKKKFDEFSDKLSKRFSEEEVEKRIPKLEEDYDYDYARENIVNQLYFDEMIKKNKLPLSERWEYKMWYREAAEPLEKALGDMGREYCRSSLKNDKKGDSILELEMQFETTKDQLKLPGFSEDVKVLSEELDEKRWQYLEARLETEEPNEKSNKALESIQKHLEKSIEAMKAMEYYRPSLENDEKGRDILKLEDQFEARKKRIKSNPDFSEDVKALSKVLAKKRWQYLEARLETEEPNKKSNKALESIQKHLEKSMKDMKAKAMEYYRPSLENDEKGRDILKLEDQFKATKKRIKSDPRFSEDVKVLSEELAKKRWQYLEVRLETKEPTEKSNKALESIQKHLEKSIEAMKAMG